MISTSGTARRKRSVQVATANLQTVEPFSGHGQDMDTPPHSARRSISVAGSLFLSCRRMGRTRPRLSQSHTRAGFDLNATPMTKDFEVIHDFDGVILHMQCDIADELAKALRRYNEYRIADGINPDSGWADVAAALEHAR